MGVDRGGVSKSTASMQWEGKTTNSHSSKTERVPEGGGKVKGRNRDGKKKQPNPRRLCGGRGSHRKGKTGGCKLNGGGTWDLGLKHGDGRLILDPE